MEAFLTSEKSISVHDKKTQVKRFDEIESKLYHAKSRVEIFADVAFRKLIFRRLDKIIPKNGILSLDVFDTLLMRDNFAELRRFVEIGERMSECVKKVKPIDAFLSRYLATKASYRAGKTVKGCREGSLTEIHQTASRLLGLNDEMKEKFIELELEYEAERVSINHLLFDYLSTHCRRGGRAILVSDMYMHADQIEQLLIKKGVDTKIFLQIFTSADSKVSKASNGIFDQIEKKLSAKTKDFLHLGDNLSGDFQNPLAHGWKALHLPIPRAEIESRRHDHFLIAEQLKQKHGLIVDISIPQ